EVRILKYIVFTMVQVESGEEWQNTSGFVARHVQCPLERLIKYQAARKPYFWISDKSNEEHMYFVTSISTTAFARLQLHCQISCNTQATCVQVCNAHGVEVRTVKPSEKDA